MIQDKHNLVPAQMYVNKSITPRLLHTWKAFLWLLYEYNNFLCYYTMVQKVHKQV